MNYISTILAFLVLFLFAVQKFSRQMQGVAGERLKDILNNWTKTPLRGLLAGTIVTGIIQSSTATSVILVSLVNAGIISFENSLGAIIGANVGTTLTAQLIALKMTYVAPLILIAGYAISKTHNRFNKYGKPMFYFGVMFLSLLAISYFLEPIKDIPELKNILANTQSLWSVIVLGAIITAVLQSSSVFTGLIIIIGGAGLIDINQALGFMLGSNIGTTVTAFIASITANREAKKVAMAHITYNVLGVLLLLPFFGIFTKGIKFLTSDITQQIVNAHFLFNAIFAVLGIIFFRPFIKLVNVITRPNKK